MGKRGAGIVIRPPGQKKKSDKKFTEEIQKHNKVLKLNELINEGREKKKQVLEVWDE